MIGETIGSYQVLAKVAEGGMGVIYLAEQPLLGRRVAIKVLRPQFSLSQLELQRFFREAKTTAALRHPSLVDVLDCGVHQPSGNAFIVMEFLEGESLGKLISRGGPLPIPDAVDFGYQIAAGVGIAHAAGIIHRDLKPDNIFLIADPWRPAHRLVKVLDFGIAKLTMAGAASTSVTAAGVVMGTPPYMAPEQCRSATHVDARSDIYSLGCILYAMLCGRPPFVYEGIGEIIVAHLAETPRPPSAFNPAVPPGLEAIVLKSLAKDPGQRYQSTAELLGALTPIAASYGRRMTSGGRDTIASHPVAGKTELLPVGAVPAPADTESGGSGRSWRELVRGDADSLIQQRPPERRPRRLVAIAATLAVLGAAAITVTALVTGGRRSPDENVAVAPPEPARLPPAAVTRRVVETPKAEPPAPLPPPVTKPRPVADRAPQPPVRPVRKVEPPAPERWPAPAATEVRRSPKPPRAASAPAPEETVAIAIRNGRDGLVVTVDGRKASLPLRLPKDLAPHTVTFKTPNFRPESRVLKGDRDQAITLDNRPAFITD